MLSLHCCLWALSSCSKWGLLSACFLLWGLLLLQSPVSRARASVVMVHRLSCPGAGGYFRPEIKPMNPASSGGFLTTGPPGKSSPKNLKCSKNVLISMKKVKQKSLDLKGDWEAMKPCEGWLWGSRNFDDVRLVRREKRQVRVATRPRWEKSPGLLLFLEAPTSAPRQHTFSWETSHFSKDRDFVVWARIFDTCQSSFFSSCFLSIIKFLLDHFGLFHFSIKI